MINISFVIITWNSKKYLERCFNSVMQKCSDTNIVYEIIVIDNGSTDGSHTILDDYKCKYPGSFQYYPLESNRGTTYSRNIGLKSAQGDYICILDSDTEMGDGSLSEILRVLTDRPEIGIVAPKLLLPDYKTQTSVKRFPTMVDKLKKLLYILFRINFNNNDYYEEFPFDGEHYVDTAISACWFIRRDILGDVGYLDENIFYSPEDLDYSIRVIRSGYNIIYYPKFTVIHYTQQVSHRKPFSKVSLSHIYGLVYFYRKHGGWIFRPVITPAIKQSDYAA